MKRYPSHLWLIVVFAIGLLLSCQEQQKVKEKKSLLKDQKEVKSSSEIPNKQWLNAFTKNGSVYQELYFNDALLIRPSGKVLSTIEQRNEFLTQLKEEAQSVAVIETIKLVNVTPKVRYEIGKFKVANGGLYKYLLIWKVNSDKQLREVEMILKSETNAYDTVSINNMRVKWMELCNAHQVKRLVSEVYHANAIYYSHKPLVVGTEAIVKEYGYMNDEKYQLTLTPIHVEPVTEDIVFEIGQCSGTYGGKYMLIWQKGEDGNWKVLFDSNV